MKIRFSKLMLVYFLFVTLFAFAGLGYGIYFFWNNGASDFNRISNIYKANIYFDELAKGEELKTIKLDVTSDGIRNALNGMEKLYNKVEKVNLLSESESFLTFEENFKSAKKSMSDLVSFPEVSSIVGVLHRKITTFNNFVTENNWRTLTRMSQRLKVKTEVSAQNSLHFYMYAKLNYLYVFIQKYKEKMISITTGSILSNEDKAKIVEQLNSFDTELKMFEGFLNSYKGISGNLKGMEVSYNRWIEETRPQLAGMKLSVESNSKDLYMGLGIFIGSLFLFTLLGFKVHSFAQKENSKIMQDSLLKLIRDGLIPFKSQVEVNGTSAFNEEFERYKDYFHKRMSFGAIFQEAVPFPSILMDSNLNLVWANKLFQEEWKINNITENEKSINWDYLQKFTNLGEDDPVFSAINQGLAGIYQIQLKLQGAVESSPYEMYVTPISFQEQQRVMIFFYPLGSLEETLTNQRRSLVGPIVKFIEGLSTSSLTENYLEKLESDFDAAGISQVYEKFITFNNKYMRDQNLFLSQIELLHGNLENSHEAFYELSEKVKVLNQKQLIQKSSFEKLKMELIAISEVKANLQLLFKTLIHDVGSIVNSKGQIESGVRSLNQNLLENQKVLESINMDKEKIKQFKLGIDDLKYTIRKKAMNANKLEGKELFNQLFKEIDDVIQTFSKTLNHLDVTMSKANIVIGQAKVVDYQSLFNGIKTIEEEFQANQDKFQTYFAGLQKQEDAMVDALRMSFESYRDLRGGVGDIATVIAEHGHSSRSANMEPAPTV